MSQNVQTTFLQELKDKEISVTVFLVNGVKLQGIITWFDDSTILLRRDGFTQLIYKHSVSTVMPSQPVDIKVD
ncbi:MAG: RNA chaperone Hfq [Alphaproteobacteria bacterium]|jgi:host factor-I protein|nr:RNA chaperone Hfq [Alphaproteobacteria bacterium]